MDTKPVFKELLTVHIGASKDAPNVPLISVRIDGSIMKKIEGLGQNDRNLLVSDVVRSVTSALTSQVKSHSNFDDALKNITNVVDCS